MSSSSRYAATTSSNPSKYSYSPAAPSTSRPGQQAYPFKPPSQPPLKPTYPTSHPSDDFSLTMPGIDPLSFFLTPPTPAPYPEDDDTAMLDFDYFDYNAGIDDQASDSVRSVSPSSLVGFARPPTPPKSSVSSPSVSTPDLEFDYGSLGNSPDSDGMEEYYRRRLGGGYGIEGGYGGVPLLLKDFTSKEKKKKFTKGSGERHYGHHHVWREPSPEVYSIEEEPVKEEMESGSEVGVGREVRAKMGRAKRVDISGRKSSKGKRVRFVLPGEEGIY